jgi:uncharacterized membrane protein
MLNKPGCRYRKQQKNWKILNKTRLVAYQQKFSRLLPLDALRGLIIILMALDHANAFIAHGKHEPELWSGQFPSYHGDTLAFLTRFVTHLAAPGFFFLMGVGMILLTSSRRQAGVDWWKIARHFLLRGALLILFQFLLENQAWEIIDPIPSPTVYFGVLYALGGVMILGSLVIWLPAKWLASLGAALILFTELSMPHDPSGNLVYSPVLRLLLLPGYSPGMYVLYPLLPWLGVASLGMAYGVWVLRDQSDAYRGALWLGLSSLLILIPLRLIGGFGNIRPPQGQDWIAFLNLVKYPPSVTFLCLTLGGNLLILWFLVQTGKYLEVFLEFLAVFGTTPLFFYITHLYLYAFMGQWIAPQGTGIPRMFPYWMLGLVVLYPLCWLYGRLKFSRPLDSIWRFL